MYQRKHSGKGGLVFKPYSGNATLEAGDTRVGGGLPCESSDPSEPTQPTDPIA